MILETADCAALSVWTGDEKQCVEPPPCGVKLPCQGDTGKQFMVQLYPNQGKVEHLLAPCRLAYGFLPGLSYNYSPKLRPTVLTALSPLCTVLIYSILYPCPVGPVSDRKCAVMMLANPATRCSMSGIAQHSFHEL